MFQVSLKAVWNVTAGYRILLKIAALVCKTLISGQLGYLHILLNTF